MKIVILTSKNHIYANFALNKLIKDGVFNNHTIKVFEQDGLLPNKSNVKGVLCYLKSAGMYYVALQIAKQFLFNACRYVSVRVNNRKSFYFPYYKNALPNFCRKRFQRKALGSTFDYIKKSKPDLILSIFSKEIIPKSIIQIPIIGCVNLHPALLPFYRGISPTFWCLANGEKKTGITLHYIDAGIDTGAIISQKEIDIKEVMTEHALYMRCAKEGAKLVSDFLYQLKNNTNALRQTIENSKEGNYYRLPSKRAVNQFYKHGYRFFLLNEFMGHSKNIF